MVFTKLPDVSKCRLLKNSLAAHFNGMPWVFLEARSITGVVTVNGAAGNNCRVSLVPAAASGSGLPRLYWAGALGRYRFNNVPAGRYVITAVDMDTGWRSKSIHVDTEL